MWWLALIATIVLLFAALISSSMPLGIRELLIVLALLVFPWSKIFGKRDAPPDEPSYHAPETMESVEVDIADGFADIGDDGVVKVPTTIDDIPIAYHYEDVGIYTPSEIGLDFDLIAPGMLVYFVRDKKNEYDPDAIGAWVDHDGFRKIGYMNRGKLRDMLSDWLDRADPIYSHIASIDDDAHKIKLYLAFYRET